MAAVGYKGRKEVSVPQRGNRLQQSAGLPLDSRGKVRTALQSEAQQSAGSEIRAHARAFCPAQKEQSESLLCPFNPERIRAKSEGFNV